MRPIRGTKAEFLPPPIDTGAAVHHRHEESTADLKELTTIAPISREAHAAHLKEKVDTRRLIEDIREEARRRREEAF